MSALDQALQRGVIDGFQPPLIAADRLTLGGLLRREGDHTAIIGKWHLGFTLDTGESGRGKTPGEASAPVGARIIDGPLSRGFDYFCMVRAVGASGRGCLQPDAQVGLLCFSGLSTPMPGRLR